MSFFVETNCCKCQRPFFIQDSYDGSHICSDCVPDIILNPEPPLGPPYTCTVICPRCGMKLYLNSDYWRYQCVPCDYRITMQCVNEIIAERLLSLHVDH